MAAAFSSCSSPWRLLFWPNQEPEAEVMAGNEEEEEGDEETCTKVGGDDDDDDDIIGKLKP